MEVVIDSNVLFRALISNTKIAKLLFDERLKFFAPEKLKEEFLNNKDEILSKSKLSESKLDELAPLLFDNITFVSLDKYKKFVPEAKVLLSKHEKDEDFIALCLMKGLKIWTYENLLFKIGFGISTEEIEKEL